MSVDVGMDVHRKRSQVAIIDAAGAQQRNRNVPNHPAQLVPILGALPPGTPVAFEAAYGWGWLVELLEELELEPHLVHPSRCKAIASARLQDDKVDAATLAQLLRADLLPQAWIAPQATRDLRALLGHRASLVRVGTAGKNRVHAILADRGIPDHSSLWTGPGRAWLADLELPATPRAIIQDRGGLLDALATPIARPEREIAALAKPDPRVQALMASPGIGKLTAMTLVAEIGDIGRFPTAPKLCAWAGLTPRWATPTAPSATAISPSRARRGCGELAGGRPDGQAPPHVRQRLRPVGPPPRQPHRHHRDRPAAAGPLLPHPDPAGTSLELGEGQSRVRSRFRMSLQHGR
jgi:transposase